jgi:phosphatidylserine/phosphatidylglycerophosphate/cardiolipin synthase-like enzyme
MPTLFTALLWAALSISSVSCGPSKAAGDADAGRAGGADAAADAGPQVKSCDPFALRASDPEVFVGPAGLREKLITLIASATRSLDLLMYELDDAQLIEAFVAAKNRGVSVRMVLDRNKLTRAEPALTAAGIEVHASPEGFPYAHAKTLLIDKNRAVIMSMNMNGYSLKGERNYGAISSDLGDIDDIARIFEADFAGTPAAVEVGCTRLLVAPLNARARLLEFIAQAQATLELSVMYVTDGALLRATLERAKAGVATRILLADPAWIKSNAATAKKFADAGVQVRYMKDFDCHAKLILSDARAFVGSENLSSNSLDANREIGMLIANEGSVAPIRTQFEADWQAGVAAP